MADELEKEAQRIIHEFLLSECVENVADYVKRGRPHSGLATDTLTRRWAEVFRRWLLMPSDPDLGRLHRDLEAELSLRDAPLPMELVEKDFDAARARFQKAIEAGALPANDEMDDLMKRLLEFARARDRPPN